MCIEQRVYACFKGAIRSVELVDVAKEVRGISARAFPGGKTRLNMMDVRGIQEEIAPDEVVILVTEQVGFWAEDVRLTRRSAELLVQAKRQYRSGSFVELLQELASRRG